MTIYILLLILIMAESYLCTRLIPDQQKREQTVLRIGMFMIFLLLALKKDTVGVDIMGYKQEYEASAAVAWSNTTYVYFEWGYIQLMKLFSKLGLPFQVFTICIYGFSTYAYYHFAQRYTKNATMSLMIFVCYQFMVFYISGLRQALAMAICVCAFLVLDGKRGKKWQRVLGALVLVAAAASIHRSAWLFLLIILVTLVKPEQVHWVVLSLVLAVSAFMRPLVLRLINMLIGRVNLESTITLGGNFLFLLGLMMLCILGNYQNGQSEEEDRFLPIASNAMMMAVIAQVLFSGSSLLRSGMYMTVFMIPGLPCALKRFERRMEIALTYFLGLFFVVLFLAETLLPNQLGLCPYLFFWQ